jgi:hypothetical protein
MVLPHFAFAGLSGRDEPDSIAAQRIDHDQHAPQRIGAQRDEPLLAFGIRIFDRDRLRITQRLLGVRKAHPMPAQLGASLGGIELNLHGISMHTICMLSSSGRLVGSRARPG